MNNPNPLVPQGSVLEQQSKGRSRVRIALFVVVALHVVFLGPLLIQGCKPESGSSNSQTNASYLAPLNASNLVDPASLYADIARTPTSAVENATGQVGSTPPGSGSFQNNFIPPIQDRVEPIPATATHKIVEGDTLGAIARTYNISLRDLMAANPNANPTRLRIGDAIMIPASSSSPSTGTPEVPAPAGDEGLVTYKVKTGDNLTKIARAHGTTIKAIQTANGLKTTGIRAGQTLRIPAKSPTSAAVESSGAAMSPAAMLAPASSNVR
jgi:LysM repeat protein